MNRTTKNLLTLIMAVCFAIQPNLAFAVNAKIQNEDVKGLSDIESSVLSTTGNLTLSSNCIASPGSTANLVTGLFIYDSSNSTYITSGTTIAGLPGTCSAGQIQMSTTANHAATGDTITFGGQPSQLINDTKIWATGVTPNQTLQSALSTGAIGGSGGSKNYLTTYTASTSSATPNTGNGNFEQGSTNGWSLGTIGTLTNGLPTGSPTFGSGASGNLSISAISSGQIQGNYSLSYASSAATTQGDMLASSAFYIDAEDQAKVLTYKMYYNVNSGAANDNFSGTSSNSFAVAVYDVTNSVFLPVTGAFSLTQNSGTGYATGVFQTGASTAQLRFIVYNANATSGATTLYMDDFSVGPQTAPIGAAMTDWQSYTPNFTALGTVTTANYFWRRVGGSVEIIGYQNNGSGTGTNAAISLPSGLTSLSSITSLQLVGYASGGGNGATSLTVLIAPSATVMNLGLQASGSPGSFAATGTSITGAAGTFQLFASIPIQGWSSNVQMSNDTDTRVVAFRATNTAGTSQTGSFANMTWTSAVDTHAAFNGTTTYTIPVSGYYHITAQTEPGSAVVGSVQGTQILQNGTIKALGSGAGTAGTSVGQANVNTTLLCSAGDTITIQTNNNQSYALSTTAGVNYWTIDRLSGPSVVAATESVNARYYSISGQSIPNSTATVVNFDTKDFDTHNAVTTGASWKFTAPVSGKYLITVNILWTAGSATGERIAYFAKNGGSNERLGSLPGNTTSYPTNNVTRMVNMLAGDFVQILVEQSSGGSLALASSDAVQQISITRVGN